MKIIKGILKDPFFYFMIVMIFLGIINLYKPGYTIPYPNAKFFFVIVCCFIPAFIYLTVIIRNIFKRNKI